MLIDISICLLICIYNGLLRVVKGLSGPPPSLHVFSFAAKPLPRESSGFWKPRFLGKFSGDSSPSLASLFLLPSPLTSTVILKPGGAKTTVFIMILKPGDAKTTVFTMILKPGDAKTTVFTMNFKPGDA